MKLPTDLDSWSTDPNLTTYAVELKTRVLSRRGKSYTYFDQAKAIREQPATACTRRPSFWYVQPGRLRRSDEMEERSEDASREMRQILSIAGAVASGVHVRFGSGD